MIRLNYRCPKWGSVTLAIREMRAAGGFWSKIFDVQGSELSRVTCVQRKCTEHYTAESGMLGNIFDFFTS